MTLRIPTDASTQVQQAFRELDDRTKDSVDINTVNKLIQQAVTKVTVNNNTTPSSSLNDAPDVNLIMRPSGPSHMHGYVPDPGMASTTNSTGSPGPANAYAGIDQILGEDAKWKLPFNGGIIESTDLVVSDIARKFEVHGALSVLSTLAADDVWVQGDLTAEGTIISKPYFCRLFNNAAIVVADATAVTLTFNTEALNSYGMHSLTANTSRITFPRKGIAIIGGSVQFAANAVGYRQLYIQLNGSGSQSIARDLRMAITVAAVQTQQSIVSAYPVSANDYAELIVAQNSGGNLNIESSANYTPGFWAILIPTA